MQRSLRPVLASVIAALCLTGFPIGAGDAAAQAGGSGETQMSPISGDPKKPRRHFRLRRPQTLGPQRAEEIYDIVRDALQRGYARSGDATAAEFRSWTRYNTAPYLSATHGNHYVNNYANEAARAYGAFEDAGTMPPGAIIAKDSFSVAETGEILLGALYVMEKMPEGFNAMSGDWRYTTILPDGSVLGTTDGENSDAVRYCIGCHMAVAQQDHLYFIPHTYRVGR